MPEFRAGQEVRFTQDHLGVIDPRITRYKFTEDAVGVGDTGIVVASSDQPEAPDGWLLVEVKGGPCYVPVHPSMIEACDE